LYWMSKISVVYWSGTGNTKIMAEAIGKGADLGSVTVSLQSVENADVEEILNSDAIALGCPAMGREILEEDKMEPFVAELEKKTKKLKGKPMALFGSYGWGDGQWMFEWEDRMKAAGTMIIDKGLIVQTTPDANGLKLCVDIGRKLATKLITKVSDIKNG